MKKCICSDCGHEQDEMTFCEECESVRVILSSVAEEITPSFPNQVSAFSGGKDSTAMVLRMAELGEDFSNLFTPTGDELPELIDHVARITTLTGKKLAVKASQSLIGLIESQKMIPNHRARWCTRILKIEVRKAYLLEHPGSTLCVGLRADEEERKGMWGEVCSYRYPLREWGWGMAEVVAYLKKRDIKVPKRSDCSLCFWQKLKEWFMLWKEYPDRFQRGVDMEELTGHTFRSPQRDTWPAALKDLRAEFEKGRVPRGIVSLPLFGTYYEREDPDKCRVCSM